jgi:hypothetical protein
MLSRRTIATGLAALALALGTAGVQAQAGKAPDALIKEVSTDVLDAVKSARSSRWSTPR